MGAKYSKVECASTLGYCSSPAPCPPARGTHKVLFAVTQSFPRILTVPLSFFCTSDYDIIVLFVWRGAGKRVDWQRQHVLKQARNAGEGIRIIARKIAKVRPLKENAWYGTQID